MLSCSVCVLSFPLPFMMSLTILSSLRWSCAVGPACESVSHDSLFTASELSTLKTWLVRSAKEPDCKVTDCGFHVKCAVTRDVWVSIHLTSRTSDHDALSLALLKEVGSQEHTC